MKKSLKSNLISKKKIKITTQNVGNTANPVLDTNGKAVRTGTASPVEVMNILMAAKGGHEITNFKSRTFDTGSIVPEVKPVAEPDLATEMYKDILFLAGFTVKAKKK